MLTKIINRLIDFNVNVFRNVSSQGSCLSNLPGDLSIQFKKVYGDEFLPGKIYSIDQHCRLIHDSLSRFCNGVS